MFNFNGSRRFSTAAKASATAIVALGLFTSSPYIRPANAIAIGQTGENATLALSPTTVSTNQFIRICAVNYNSAPVNVDFVLTDVTNEPFVSGTLLLKDTASI